jgi:hypothetical protein
MFWVPAILVLVETKEAREEGLAWGGLLAHCNDMWCTTSSDLSQHSPYPSYTSDDLKLSL